MTWGDLVMAGVVADSNISAHSHISPYLVWSLLTMTPFPDTHGNKIKEHKPVHGCDVAFKWLMGVLSPGPEAVGVCKLWGIY